MLYSTSITSFGVTPSLYTRVNWYIFESHIGVSEWSLASFKIVSFLTIWPSLFLYPWNECPVFDNSSKEPYSWSYVTYFWYTPLTSLQPSKLDTSLPFGSTVTI